MGLGLLPVALYCSLGLTWQMTTASNSTSVPSLSPGGHSADSRCGRRWLLLQAPGRASSCPAQLLAPRWPWAVAASLQPLPLWSVSSSLSSPGQLKLKGQSSCLAGVLRG